MKAMGEGRVLAYFRSRASEDRALLNSLVSVLRASGVTNFGLWWALGEADLLLQFSTLDFREARKIQSRLTRRGVSAGTWIFAVPYEFSTTVLHMQEPVVLIHLHVNSDLYRCEGVGAEKYIVDSINHLFTSTDALDIDVMFCLGSPDLIVAVPYKAEDRTFVSRLAVLRSLSWPSESPVDLFTESLSMVGLPMRLTGGNDSADITFAETGLEIMPVVLAKVSSTFFLRRSSERTSPLVTSLPKITLIEGSYDALVEYQAPFSTMRSFVDALDDLYDMGAKNTLSHVLAVDKEIVSEQINSMICTISRDAGAVGRVVECCRCREVALTWLRDLSEEIRDVPEELRGEIDNVLTLYQSALLDRTACCECVSAYQGVVTGLAALLDKARECRSILCSLDYGFERKREASDYLRDHLEAVGQWCLRSTRVLRERTSDSLEGLFDSRSSVPETRGSLRKLLTLADRILNDFGQRLPSNILRRQRDHIQFTSVYEPIGRIMNDTFTGIVRIPLRYAFSMHLVLPQLWHEVGQYVFQHRHIKPGSSVTRVACEMLGDYPNGKRLLVTEAADCVADALVFVFGFRRSIELFSEYLLTCVLDFVLYFPVPQIDQKAYFEMLLRRLYCVRYIGYVLECFQRDAESAAGEGVESWLRRTELEFISNEHHRAAVRSDLQEMVNKPRYANSISLLRLTREERKNMVKDTVGRGLHPVGVIGAIFVYLRALLVDLIDSKDAGHSETDTHIDEVWPRLQTGEIVELNSFDFGDLYYRLFVADLQMSINTPHGSELYSGSDVAVAKSRFRLMAALGKSCSLSLPTGIQVNGYK